MGYRVLGEALNRDGEEGGAPLTQATHGARLQSGCVRRATTAFGSWVWVSEALKAAVLPLFPLGVCRAGGQAGRGCAARVGGRGGAVPRAGRGQRVPAHSIPPEQMGRILQRTAISTNIKERLDFSCALFGPDGGLVSNAPHIPVHLGAMQETVQFQVRRPTSRPP